MNAISVKNLTKEYNGTVAVNNLSLTVKKGEILGFLGPNGAGKTTTIHCIAQLASVTKGSIKVNGYDIKKDYVEAKKQIGLSPQEIAGDFYFKIKDIVQYQAGYFGIRKKEAKKRTEKLLKEFGLWGKKEKRLRELSGGMKRKLSLAKALIHKPKILILDEPTTGLDVDTRYELWELIKGLKEKGITIILTTHYIEEAEKLSDRIAIISKGNLIKLEDTKNIMEELSQNVIKIYLTNKNKVKKVSDLEFEQDKDMIKIKTTRKKQNKNLNKALQSLAQQKINIKNFDIEQDNLENIFRRLIYEK